MHILLELSCLPVLSWWPGLFWIARKYLVPVDDDPGQVAVVCVDITLSTQLVAVQVNNCVGYKYISVGREAGRV